MEPKSLKINNRIVCKACRGENKVYRCKGKHCSQCTDLKITVCGNCVTCDAHYNPDLVLNTNCEYCDKPLYDNYCEYQKELKCKNCKTYNEISVVRCYNCNHLLVPALSSISKKTISTDASRKHHSYSAAPANSSSWGNPWDSDSAAPANSSSWGNPWDRDSAASANSSCRRNLWDSDSDSYDSKPTNSSSTWVRSASGWPRRGSGWNKKG